MLHPAIFELYEKPFAMLPARLNALVQLLTTTDATELRSQQSRETYGASGSRGGRAGFLSWGSTAVIHIYGIITHRPSLLSYLFGGTSAMETSASLRQALADPNVSSIVFDVDSPGGSVEGIQELSDEIFAARGKKFMVTVSNAMLASAAYWIGSAAHEIVVTPSGQVGSIGVYTAHEDISKALEKEGVKITLIRAGKYKAEDSPFEPLTEEARAHMQAMVNIVGDTFTNTVARNRGVSAASVRSGFGQGRMVLAGDSVRERLADRVATMTQTIGGLGKNGVSSSAMSARHAARLREMQLYGDTVH